ncbi:ion channel CASTOR-like isoform X2 [Primulina eburnea]|uniref:ion channel CASTOR-like isoform X2 n=1 Tax=Primulina eburnea TaxID=1245227 RepID=UPI003C6BFF9A
MFGGSFTLLHTRRPNAHGGLHPGLTPPRSNLYPINFRNFRFISRRHLWSCYFIVDMSWRISAFGVTDDHLADSFWLSWTYVADSGNHENSKSIGSRLVFVSISFGGMLIFVMMLGIVSDVISEKFDSLRKGKGEAVEKNHTLILGWSDKLSAMSDKLYCIDRDHC